MLPLENRLKKNEDFKKVYKEGLSLANIYLVMCFKKRNDLKAVRIGFGVSKKLGSAVERNRIKRKLRAAACSQINNILRGYDIFFIARLKIKGICFDDVEKSMISLLKKAQITNRKV